MRSNGVGRSGSAGALIVSCVDASGLSEGLSEGASDCVEEFGGGRVDIVGGDEAIAEVEEVQWRTRRRR